MTGVSLRTIAAVCEVAFAQVRVHAGLVDKPAQRPEGKLLQDALKKSGLSARKLASMVAMSDSRVRQILNGYQPAGKQQYIAVVGPADTVAKMADVLDVEEEDLSAAGRSDAAELLGQRRTTTSRRRHPSRSRDGKVPEQIMAEFVNWWDAGEDVDPPAVALSLFSDEQVTEEVRVRLVELRDAATRWMTQAVQLMDEKEGGQSDAGQAEAEKNVEQGSVTHGPFGERGTELPDDVAADRQNRPTVQERDPSLQAQRRAGEENQDPGE